MRGIFLLSVCFVIFSTTGLGQDKKIDQIEILYDQGYYAKVLRKSSKLISRPEYDYSGLPAYYKSLALFRMSNEDIWFKRHNNAIEEAVNNYRTFISNDKFTDYLSAHYHEIASLKSYLVNLETKFKNQRLTNAADRIQSFRLNELKEIKARPDFAPIEKPKDKPTEIVIKDNVNTIPPKEKDFRRKMVVYAKSLVGIKYKWAGMDTKGFDCSGFVGYVYKKYGVVIPRTASAQMSGSKKVKLNNAFKGDLLFFSSGSSISHVGLVVNDEGNDLIMVHASTSKGIIITEIEKSTYWKPKLKAAGTFI